jgi:hypothetical protein
MLVLAAREEIRDEAAAPVTLAADPQVADLQVADTQVADAQVADTQVADAQVADTPDNDPIEDKASDPVQHRTVASRGVTTTLACLAALLVGGAAIANLLPNVHGLSLLKFDRFTLPKFDHIAFPSFHRTSAPKPAVAVAALTEPPKPLRETISVPIIDPAVTTSLKDIRSSQDQSTVVLASLTRSASNQQDDLKRISRQLSGLAMQMEAMAPMTTSSIPRMTAGIPYPTSASIPHPHARARLIRTSHRSELSLPPPVGPVSVGGAPLSPAPQGPAPAPAPVAVSSAK